MTGGLKLIKRSRIAFLVLCVVLATAGLLVLSQMNQIAEAAILTPIESPPETIFYDDFSGDLTQWTVVSGTWSIEGGQLKSVITDGQNYPHIIYVDNSVADFAYEATLRKVEGSWGGLMFRGSSLPSESGDYYLVVLGHPSVGVDSYWIAKWTSDSWITLVPWSKLSGLDITVGATIKVDFRSSTLKVYIEETNVYSGIETFRASGVFGCAVSGWRNGNTTYYFDDVNVSSLPTTPTTAFNLDVRAEVAQIVITCTWSGNGNITIANLTSPTKTYYETNMSIYEKTTLSVGGATTSTFNIRRVVLSISTTSSEEAWILYLNLKDVTAYEVSAETS